jgi:hypothetical protein
MALSQTKPFFQSKTFWFNFLTIGGVALDGLLGLLPVAQTVIPLTAYPWVMLAVGFVNIVLRAITTGPIDWTEAQAQERDVLDT